MKKFLIKILFITIILITSNLMSSASSMFDENGSYSGNWKPMTNVNYSNTNNKYNSSNYSSSNWYAVNSQKQRYNNAKASYSAQNNTKANTTPYRYNTLNYTRIRHVQGGYGDYSAKCSDIGDVSFCH